MGSMEYNITQQEEDPFGDINPDIIVNYERNIGELALHYTFIITEIIKLILCICVVVFDIFLIYVICRFKKLQCHTNSYIMHYSALNILYFVSSPIFFIMLELIPYLRHYNVICLITDVETSCLLTSFLFAFGLGFDWLVMCFKPTIGTKISKYYKHFIWIMYVFGLITFLSWSISCINEFSTVSHIIAQLTYFLTLVFIIVLNYLKYVRNASDNNAKISHSLIVANIIILSWLPMFIYHYLWNFIPDDRLFLSYFLWLTEFIPEWIGYGHPIVIVFVLGRLNKNFKMAYLKVFKRSVASYSNNEDNLDESDNESHTQPTTQVSYNNDVPI